MRLTLAAAAFVLAGGAAMAQGTTPSTNPPGTAPTAIVPPAAAPATPPSTTPSTSAATTPTTRAGGPQTPAASVNTTPQTTSASPSSVQTKNTTQRTAAAPVAGRNSFTMSQAARRITTAGYTKVMGLKKDGQGIWRGQAEKDGNPVSVSLDYQGNVTGQ